MEEYEEYRFVDTEIWTKALSAPYQYDVEMVK
jgi:hypothetical protein